MHDWVGFIVPEETAHDSHRVGIFSQDNICLWEGAIYHQVTDAWDESDVTCQFDLDQMRFGPFSVV